ncbi:MAG TPA: UpxY family transcription antiterminator, partial [Bacteroidales bacterium]|nr:UpxY family transcription antiterminator [Bacteroidales bacterium]HPS72301.1 UpxY family transcription antiterminator [Bacteroidales bacterium]
VPLIRKVKLVDDKPVEKLVPAINNYIFVFCTISRVQQLKEEMEEQIPIRFLYNPLTKKPQIIRKKEMEDFILVAGSLDEQLVYLKPGDINLSKGDKVKIIAGPFKGVEGTFIRIKGDRRVVVTIEGLMAVATTFIHPSLIVPINKNN